MNEDEISPITFADETSLADLEDVGRMVAHELYHSLYRKDSLINQLKHTDQTELHHRHSAYSSAGTSFFLAKQMGGMVCSYTLDASIVEGTSESSTVSSGLDGRITFDETSQAGIIGIGVKQMRHAYFSRNLVVVGEKEF